jgi:hypothetical protein
MPYAAPKRMEMYIDPGREKVWTLECQHPLRKYTIDVQEVCNHSTSEDSLGIKPLVLLEQRAVDQRLDRTCGGRLT